MGRLGEEGGGQIEEIRLLWVVSARVAGMVDSSYVTYISLIVAEVGRSGMVDSSYVTYISLIVAEVGRLVK